MSKPIAAIVGRPNVGKSTLFNKIIGERRSIVEDTPGVTRDRIYGDAEWNGRKFLLVDTGGIEPKTDDLILKKMRFQAEVAIESADVIIFICDIHAGLVADDRDIAVMLKKSGKPVVICVNKMDRVGTPPADYYEFYELGFDMDPIILSSLHGTGTGDLLDAVVSAFPPPVDEEEEDDVISVAVIGKPNAGKSSIINRIVGSERLIVSNIPGTTRDAVDTFVENEHGRYNFIDTAGIRRQSKVVDSIERYSVLRAKMAVDRADVCLIMADANEGITEQDERIAGIAHEAGKASIIVMNKWDDVEKDNATVKEFTKRAYDALSYMTYAPIAFVSAKTGQRVAQLYEKINSVYAEACRRVTTGMLNDLLADAMARHQPPSDKGKRLKIYYMTQISTKPPTFVIFCNSEELFHFSYRRYLENCLRETFGFEGTPIRLVIRQKGDEGDKD
ncbi:MAG: ribosome biogenesis GTPase Der [Clostridia bacterium]|nr:ribosome biogenesis GTPase Der [Clostridia bacterium]